jgi:hypothetical protein
VGASSGDLRLEQSFSVDGDIDSPPDAGGPSPDDDDGGLGKQRHLFESAHISILFPMFYLLSYNSCFTFEKCLRNSLVQDAPIGGTSPFLRSTLGREIVCSFARPNQTVGPTTWASKTHQMLESAHFSEKVASSRTILNGTYILRRRHAITCSYLYILYPIINLCYLYLFDSSNK